MYSKLVHLVPFFVTDKMRGSHSPSLQFSFILLLGPPSPPVPVLHSPPRKVTVKEQQMWKIPPCVSNWKNAKGYTIPLDKRLAADGRGLQEVRLAKPESPLVPTFLEAPATLSVPLYTPTLGLTSVFVCVLSLCCLFSQSCLSLRVAF